MEDNEKTINPINLEQKVTEIIKELTVKMGFETEVEVKRISGEEKESLVYNIKTEESNFLIGQYGINLQSLQHIARLLVRKKIAENANFILDVNSYRQDKNNSIIKMAHDLAEQALLEEKAVVLRPMSPYERRLIHLELSKDERVKTESIGEREDRRIVIKPADLI